MSEPKKIDPKVLESVIGGRNWGWGGWDSWKKPNKTASNTSWPTGWA